MHRIRSWGRRRQSDRPGSEQAEIAFGRLLAATWPRYLRKLRKALPSHLQESPAPATASRGSWFVLATANDKVIGYAWAVALAGREDAVYIEEVVVAEDHQREGIGSQLLREMARWMLDLGRTELSIYPIYGDTWVTKAGFEKFDDGRTYIATAAAVCETSPAPA